MRGQKNIPLILSLLVITIYSFIAYSIFIPFLGFYNDDWLFGYLGHFYGSSELIQGFAGDRPIVGYLFAINHIFLGDNLFLWHIYMFLMRLSGGYILFFLLKKLWPNRLIEITNITLLFLIYPGFLQQSVPLGYQNYITALTTWIISLFFTVYAVKSRSKIAFALFTLAALIFQVFSFLLLEFFIGMEILRLSIIAYITFPTLNRMNFVELKKNIKYLSPYIPYTISITFFILWRIFIFKSLRAATDIDWITQNYYSNPVWIAKIPLKTLYSFISTTFLSYFTPIIIRLTRIPLDDSIISLFIGTISGTLLYFYYRIMGNFQNKQNLNDSTNSKWGKILLLIGFISVFAALVPIIISGRFVSELYDNNNFDRYTISSIIGVVFILIGFLLSKTSKIVRNWILILLVTLSITTHLMNGYWRTIIWGNQKDIWWQIYWRTPQIQKDALLIFDFPEIINNFKSQDTIAPLYKTLRVEDYQIWAPGNLFFNYNNLPANHFSGQYLIDKDTAKKIKDKTIEVVTQASSTIKYENNFNNTIIISLPSKKSCLWILDGEREELPNNASKLAKSNISYSNIDKLVQKDDISTIPPTNIFGNEPSKTWCYYFQKASIARQLKDWYKLSLLTQEVLEKKIKPEDVNEWLPFLEGLIISRKYQQAEDLIKIASESGSETFINNLCRMINRLRTEKFKRYCQ